MLSLEDKRYLLYYVDVLNYDAIRCFVLNCVVKIIRFLKLDIYESMCS